jgi:hypothetical protein
MISDLDELARQAVIIRKTVMNLSLALDPLRQSATVLEDDRIANAFETTCRIMTALLMSSLTLSAVLRDRGPKEPRKRRSVSREVCRCGLPSLPGIRRCPSCGSDRKAT